MHTCTILALLLPLAGAHFTIEFPGSRGFNEDQHSSWPCGGFNSPSSNRSSFPLTGAPLQIDSSHTRSLLQVVMAVGNDPGENFNYVVVPTFQQAGPGEFCFGDVTIPSFQGLNLTEGSNATLQVISGGGEGGLYACVDVTFASTPLGSDQWEQNCKNNTGITTAALEDSGINANESTTVDLPTASEGATGTSETGTPASSSSTAGAAHATMVGWLIGALGVVGGVIAL